MLKKGYLLKHDIGFWVKGDDATYAEIGNQTAAFSLLFVRTDLQVPQHAI